MPWVYILKGSSGRHYIGSTADLERRFRQHCQGHTHTTKRLGSDLRIIASLKIGTLEEARKLERDLKRKKNPQLALQTLREMGAQSAW